MSETENRTSCLTTVSQIITVSSCQSDVSNHCQIEKPRITGMAEKSFPLLEEGGAHPPITPPDSAPKAFPYPPPPTSQNRIPKPQPLSQSRVTAL